MNTASETKRRKRTLIIYDALAFLFLAIAAIIFSINHICAIFAIPLLLIGLVFASLALRLTLINFGSTHVFATRWGFGVAIPSVLLCGLLFCFELKSGRPEPKPHFTFELQTMDLPAAIVALTNDCLFRAGMVNVITNFSNGYLFFNGIAAGCVVIPVRDGESNAVFRFIAESDSSVNVSDLEIAVGFPDFWNLGLDLTKWQQVGEHMTVPGWRLQITNLQFWATQSPRRLVGGDSVGFSAITNFSIPESNNSSNKTGLFRLYARATGFEEELGANLLFVRVATNEMFKPFVTEMRLGKDGFWRPEISSNVFENSQK
jgi:hypothetical protein